MSVKMRREVEEKIVGAIVDAALKAGYRLTVSLERGYDHADCLLGSTDRARIMAEAFAGDDCHIFLHAAEGPLVSDDTLTAEQWVYLVFGNDGWDVVSDYLIDQQNEGLLMAEANRLSDHYS